MLLFISLSTYPWILVITWEYMAVLESAIRIADGSSSNPLQISHILAGTFCQKHRAESCHKWPPMRPSWVYI